MDFKTVTLPTGDELVIADGDAPGSLPAGTRVTKVWGRPEDLNPLGAQGVVVSSWGPTPLEGLSAEDRAALPADAKGDLYFYFVEWDSTPGLPVGTISPKIEKA